MQSNLDKEDIVYIYEKIEAMDLYEGFNGINPKMIEEAEKYKKLLVWMSDIKRTII